MPSAGSWKAVGRAVRVKYLSLVEQANGGRVPRTAEALDARTGRSGKECGLKTPTPRLPPRRRLGTGERARMTVPDAGGAGNRAAGLELLRRLAAELAQKGQARSAVLAELARANVRQGL